MLMDKKSNLSKRRGRSRSNCKGRSRLNCAGFAANRHRPWTLLEIFISERISVHISTDIGANIFIFFNISES